MGSCVSKKAARGAAGVKVAAPLPPEKENALPPVVVEEEVKEVLSETPVVGPRPPEPEQEKVKRMQEHEEQEVSDIVSAVSSVAEKVEKRVVAADLQEKGRARRRAPEQRKPRDAGNGRARSPSPASGQRRQGAIGGEQPVAPLLRREQPAVVSGIGCRSGRFSPSAARRAAESAVRRTYSARETDMMLTAWRTSAKRCLNASISGNGNGAYGGSGVRRDTGERSGRRPDSPTARGPPASPAANGTISRQASTGAGAARKGAPKENASPEQTKKQCGGGRGPGKVRDGEVDEAALAGREHNEAAEGALGQNPSMAMECFIFL